MSKTATATLQTPWDCKWSRFGRMRATRTAPAEGLWVCLQADGSTRRPIAASQCETCPHWEYEPPVMPRDTHVSEDGTAAPAGAAAL
jgi:hypothetical protein